jgi:hypothetical protein
MNVSFEDGKWDSLSGGIFIVFCNYLAPKNFMGYDYASPLYI